MTIRSSSRAATIDTSDARPNFVASSSAIVRADAARAALKTSASAPREVVSPASSGDAGGGHERGVEAQAAQEVERPATGDRARVLVELAGADDDVQLLGADLGGDHRRVGDERQLVRRVLREPPRQRERARRRVEEDRRAAGDHRRRLLGDRRLGRPRLRRRGGPTRSGAAAGRRRASARAPPRTRSTSPSRASCSRSRCAVIVETAWSRASSATVAPPRALDLLEDLGAAQRCRERAHRRAPRRRRARPTGARGAS